MDKKEKKILLLIGILIALIILVIVKNLFLSDIFNIKKVLNNKYDSIKCVDSDCNYLYAKKDKKIKLYDYKGNLVSNYTLTKNNKNVYNVTKSYFLSKYISNNQTEYSINNLHGKSAFQTKNKLTSLNDKFIIMLESSAKGNVYTILDKNGKKKYKNIIEYNKFANDKYIYINSENKQYVIDKNGKKILKNYSVKEEVKNKNSKYLYLIVKNSENNLYYYFDIDENKIIGDGFINYTKNSDNSLLVVKKINNKNINYTVTTNGTQTKGEIASTNSEIVSRIKQKIDKEKYYLYTISVVKYDQKNVLVDSKEENSIGILNVETNEFVKLYSYNTENSYSMVNKIDSLDGDLYLQLTCDKSKCENEVMEVLNFSKYKTMFKLEKTDLIASNYVQYKNGYKVVKYSYQSENEKYKGNYVLYDKNDKEKLISKIPINIIDDDIVLGKLDGESFVLYSYKNKKQYNTDEYSATKIDIDTENYYKYSDKKGSYIINSKGENIYSTSNGTLEFSNNFIYAIGNKIIKIYDIKNDSVNTYKLKTGETILSENKVLNDYVLIKNKKYIKIINHDGKIVKTIKNIEIYKTEINKKKSRAYVITSKNKKYGLYIIK